MNIARKRRAIAAILLVVLAVVIAGLGSESWRGGGFRADGSEMRRLREVLQLRPGMSVADVGAGGGELTMALSAEVSPSGQVFSTDVDSEALELIRARSAAAARRNVTVLQAQPGTTGLPINCCDAIVVRRVYHHLSDPAAINGDLVRAVRPGGVLAVIDFPPALSWLWPWPPTGVPPNRNGHGVAAGLVVAEVTSSGFELMKMIDDWPGRGPLGSYCAVFLRPSRATASTGSINEVIEPVRLSDEPAEDADADWHVQPVPPGVAEPDLEKYNREQPDTEAGHPDRNVASPPQDDRSDGLDQRTKQQGTRAEGVGGPRVIESGQEGSCR
jgi:SAM-dependent methyltransferase